MSGADLQRPGSHDLGAILAPDRALEQPNALARPDDLYIDAKLAKRDGTKKLVGDPSERQPLGGFQAFELADHQGGRSTTVLRSRIPRSARQLGGDEPAILGDEYGLFGHRDTP